MYNEFVKNNPAFKPHGTEYIQNMVHCGLSDGTHSAVIKGKRSL